MNARLYRVKLNLSPLDFPPIMGLGESSVNFKTEVPYIQDGKMVLDITKTYMLLDMNDNSEHQILSAQSIYKIPVNDIKSREFVHEFYNDAILSLNEAYQYVKKQLPALPTIVFPNQPIEAYQQEIDRVFDLLISRN